VDNPLITSVEDLRPDFSDQSLIIYPNPVISQAAITYEIPVTGTVDISVWNLQGQKMGTLFRGTKAKGTHSLVWNTRQLRPAVTAWGQYILVIDVDGRRMKKPFIMGR
jgi:hypothetical protein